MNDPGRHARAYRDGEARGAVSASQGPATARAAEDGLSFGEAMRLLAGAGIGRDEIAGQSDLAWSVRRVTAAEAFLLRFTKLGLDGDIAAAGAAIAAIGDIRGTDVPVPRSIKTVVQFVSPGCVNTAVEYLRIGTKLDRYGETARMVLEPWIVEAALALCGKPTDPRTAGNRAKGHPNTGQGPVARLVGR